MTLASDQTTARSADREGIPPTLLRLPDLDPPPADAFHEAVVETAAKKTPQTDSDSAFNPPEIQADAGNPPQSPRSAMRSHVEAAVSAAFIVPEPAADSASPTSEKPFVEPAHRSEPCTTHERVQADEATWLTLFASRKTLLVLLALIAGIAVVLPRGEDGTSDHETPMLVDLGPTSTVLPASSSNSLPDPNEAFDGAEALHATRSSGAKLRQPIASHNPSRSHLDISEPILFEPPTPKPQLASMSPSVNASSQDAPSFETVDDFDMTIALPSEATPANERFPTATQTSLFAPSSDAEPASGLTRAASDPAEEEPAARLVESRTPNAITNWKKFLPGMNVAESSGSASPSTDTEIRTSTAPAEPNFEFALPVEPSVDANGAIKATSIPTNATPPGSTPEARVAMPPTPATPTSRY